MGQFRILLTVLILSLLSACNSSDSLEPSQPIKPNRATEIGNPIPTQKKGLIHVDSYEAPDAQEETTEIQEIDEDLIRETRTYWVGPSRSRGFASCKADYDSYTDRNLEVRFTPFLWGHFTQTRYYSSEESIDEPLFSMRDIMSIHEKTGEETFRFGCIIEVIDPMTGELSVEVENNSETTVMDEDWNYFRSEVGCSANGGPANECHVWGSFSGVEDQLNSRGQAQRLD